MGAPSSASCAARHSVSTLTAALLAAYTDADGNGEIGPSDDDVLTTCPASPASSMRGTKVRTPLTTPVTLTPNTQAQSFGVVCQTLALGAPTPALLHRTWQAPKPS